MTNEVRCEMTNEVRQRQIYNELVAMGVPQMINVQYLAGWADGEPRVVEVAVERMVDLSEGDVIGIVKAHGDSREFVIPSRCLKGGGLHSAAAACRQGLSIEGAPGHQVQYISPAAVLSATWRPQDVWVQVTERGGNLSLSFRTGFVDEGVEAGED